MHYPQKRRGKFMQIRQLEYFVAVSEHLNFTRAAEQFYIAQSSITQQIKALEEEVGVKLFNRNNRHVELTPAGKTFLEDARAIIKRSSDAVARARQSGTEFTGHLNFGFIKGYEKTDLSETLSKFHESYPNISLNLLRENVSELYDGLLDHSLDYVINMKYSEDDMEKIESRLLGCYPLMAVLPVAHPLSHKGSIKRSELKGYPFIDIKRSETRYGEKTAIMNAFSKAGFLPEKSYVSNDIETSLLAVAAGLGYALLPGYITDSLYTKNNVVAVPLEGENRRIAIVGAWNPENKNPALEKFREFMENA